MSLQSTVRERHIKQRGAPPGGRGGRARVGLGEGWERDVSSPGYMKKNRQFALRHKQARMMLDKHKVQVFWFSTFRIGVSS